ncbi:MAG: hypothetical protein V2I48_14260 [Xanthomonadales bacterium]|jgi:hypothetical protein|nr:hypothetical protein [Xanthomonadales bacterium]
MRTIQANKKIRIGIFMPVLLLCLGTSGTQAADQATVTPILPNGTLKLISESSTPVNVGTQSYPLVMDPNAGLDFDLGGSETQKLQLQLGQPLSLHGGTRARVLDNGSNLLGLDATLNVPVADNFSLTAGVDKQVGTARFQSLGSIQCMNGVLRADSYTASGCRFVNEPIATSEQRRIDLGAKMDFSNASTSINWFNQDAAVRQAGVQPFNQVQGQATLAGPLLSPNLGNPLVPNSGGDPLQYLNSEASGVDLNFKVGITTDNSGDIQLGLAFSHILEAEYQGIYASSAEALSWTVAEPFNSAQMNLEWSRGSFSGGIQGFYRDSVDFLNRNSVDSLTTFDVHFTWRTPWNANLTVGASNLTNAGAENVSSVENTPVDPLESIYGRIPYVRYKQDL